MTIYEYGNPDADTVLIQLTGDHELSVLKNEVEEIRKRWAAAQRAPSGAR